MTFNKPTLKLDINYQILIDSVTIQMKILNS